MSRVFSDHDLLTWEAYPTGGAYGLPRQAKIVLHCLSERTRRSRFVVHNGDDADAAGLLQDASTDELLDLLGRSRPLP